MKLVFLSLVLGLFSMNLSAVQVGEPAPDFKLESHEGKIVALQERKNKGWTVLFFYPKAGTPGCTKQACAFRDSIKQIKDLNAEVYGVSADTVPDQAKFHKEHKLSFALLADPNLEVIKKYGAKMEGRDLSQRFTFIIDPNLIVRAVDLKVDPVMDSKNVADQLKKLQSKG